MADSLRSLADSLRRFDDQRLERLLSARPDLLHPLPHGLGALAARATGSLSARRALGSLTAAELAVVDALAVLGDGASPPQIAALLDAPSTSLAAHLDRLRTLALLWGEDELRLVRAVRDGLRSPAGLAPVHAADPSADEARALLDRAPAELAPALDRLRWAPGRLEAGTGDLADRLLAAGIAVADGSALRIPRSVHLALRGGRLLASFPQDPPDPGGTEIRERITGTRTAGAVERALDAVRVLDGVLGWDDETAPGVLRRGGLPQRDLRRLAADAGIDEVAVATILQSGWLAGLLGHDGETWAPTADWAELWQHGPEHRWAELALAWAHGDHLAVAAGEADATGTPRALLSEATRIDQAAARRARLLRILAAHAGRDLPEQGLHAALAWWHPLVPARTLARDVRAVLDEGAALGLLDGGAPTVLGETLVEVLEADLPTADSRLTEALVALAPAPVDEVLLGADLTIVVPGRPSPRLAALETWTEVVSRGGALTLRATPASVRGALQEGRDAEELLGLLREASRTPIPQALEYLVHDEQRRLGQVHVGTARAYVTGEEDAIALLLAQPGAASAGLQRLAPTVAIAACEPRMLLRLAAAAGLSPLADGDAGAQALRLGARGPADGAAARRSGGEAVEQLVRAPATPGPSALLEPAEAVARLRRAESGEGAPSTVDLLLEASAAGRIMSLGIVDGRGGIERVDAVPLGVEDGRLRARAASDGEEFTVLVQRVTLD
ncbi:helicase-associated domain-containing protein [Brachybacterium sp. MASK1Z-5]|uniref:Helicase-associated domain-containing protein n=1 Tax=Brachybacterium halotolerans TaxID=2795215 RepID=A0ABS1BD86_9MICO|nr:helicase-associated domain-containing protein [Brachybacterium halotolerans]MBK0332561.1 helicase-associated domain-containing protein [Brachybacterium halotolerans]